MSENNPLPDQTTAETGFKAFWNRPIKTPEGKPPRTMGQEILSWVVTIVSAVLIALVIRTFVFELGAVFLLPLLLGVDGIWSSVVFAEFMAAVTGAIFMAALQKKYHY